MKKVLVTLTAFLALVGCGGGGNGGGDSSTGLTHNELAANLVAALNSSGEYSVSLAKDSTLKYNYVVIYDRDLDEYDAVNIDKYVPGMDPVTFIEVNAIVYYDLDVLPGYYDYEYYSYYDYYCECYLTDTRSVYVPTRFRDRYTGYIFEKSKAVSKDLEKYGALAEEKLVGERAETVAAKFGLSVDRSKEVVRLSMAWKRAGGKDLTAKDQDSFSKELLGFSITDAKSAASEKAAGNDKAIDELVEKAAEANNTSPENVRQVIDQYFGQK